MPWEVSLLGRLRVGLKKAGAGFNRRVQRLVTSQIKNGLITDNLRCKVIFKRHNDYLHRPSITSAVQGLQLTFPPGEACVQPFL